MKTLKRDNSDISGYWRKGRTWVQVLILLILSNFLLACASSQSQDDESGAMSSEVKIDCEQEANKYRKPCRGDRW